MSLLLMIQRLLVYYKHLMSGSWCLDNQGSCALISDCGAKEKKLAVLPKVT